MCCELAAYLGAKAATCANEVSYRVSIGLRRKRQQHKAMQKAQEGHCPLEKPLKHVLE
jgi:hypothetical protein